MVEESRWDVVYRRLIAEGRERVGEPPSVDEIEALFNGHLSDEEAAHVRERLVYYPELTRVMTQPPPQEDIRVLTDQERAEQWAALRKRIAGPIPLPAPGPWRRLLPYAAAATLVVLAVAIAYVERQSNAPAAPDKRPLVARRVERRDLRPDAIARGNERPPAIALGVADEYALNLLTAHETPYARYRVDIVDVETDRLLWTRPDLPDSPNGAFAIAVPSQVLRAGRRYQIALSANDNRIATYTVRVSGK